MTPPTCQEIREQLDLYAAGECDAAAARAVREHLAGCADCARVHDRAREMLGLLDLHFREADGLRQLYGRLGSEAPRRRRRWQPAVQRVAALAALVLLTFGLSWWSGALVRRSPEDGAATLALALRSETRALAPPGVAMVRGQSEPGEYVLDLKGATPEEFARRLRADAGTDRLPPPPEVHLGLVLRNTGSRPLRVAVGDSATELRLVLSGPGVVRVPAPVRHIRTRGMPRVVTVMPGKEFMLPVSRLADVAEADGHYLYWTRPGEYALTVRGRLAVAPAPPGSPHVDVPGWPHREFGWVGLASAPTTLHVRAAP
jgi:hypothetical protein